MKSRIDEFNRALAAKFSSDGDCILFGEVRGYNEELMKSTTLSFTWDSSKFDKSIGIIKYLEDKVITNNVD